MRSVTLQLISETRYSQARYKGKVRTTERYKTGLTPVLGSAPNASDWATVYAGEQAPLTEAIGVFGSIHATEATEVS